jgi:Ca-activated chloride channel family protein
MQKGLLVASISALALSCTLLLAKDPAADAGAVQEGESSGTVVSLSSGISHPRVLAGEPQEVFVHVALSGAERPGSPRLPMNLALVIDRSGSMASEDKLRFAKSAAEQLVNRLRPDDQLAIVAYDDVVLTSVPSAPAREQERFLAAIRALVPGNRTDLHGGMVRGYEEVLAHFDERKLNGILLLSDGLANVGVIVPGEIAKRAADCRGRGVRISTMGMGVEYDEDLLNGIAQHAGGNYYYVGEAETVGRFLDEELDELGLVTARDVELRVKLGEGVTLREVYGRPHRMEGREVVIPLRDVYSGQNCKAVARLSVQGGVGEQRVLATASLHYRDAVSRAACRQQGQPLEVGFTDRIDEVLRSRNRDVLVQAEIVQNAMALDAAMQLQKEGQFQAAQELLAARYLNSKTLNDTEFRDSEVQRTLNRIQQVMLDLERTRSNPRARRDLQLLTELQALGYAGGD